MADQTVTAPPAVAEETQHVEVENYTTEQRDKWIRTGVRPGDEEIKPKAGESATPKPVDAEKSAVEKNAESGTARRKPDQERNWKELREKAAKADKLEKELAELKAGKTTEAPKDEKTAASLAAPSSGPQPPERPKRPKLAEFKDVPEWETAMEKYEDELLTYPAKKQAFDDAKANFDKQQTLLNEKNKAVNDAWAKITEKGREIYGEDGWKKAITESNLPIYQHDPVERFIRDSEPETAAHLFRYFSLKRADLERIIALPARQQFKELEALETAMQQELGKAEPEAEPPTKEVTAARKPPSEVGSKGTSPSGDPALAALKRGDQEGYRKIMNDRDIAARKSRGR
jgi:hypothetical protein